MDEIVFDKLSGSGNDFICIDNRRGRYADLLASPERIARLARALCHRGTGVGADGVIFACEPQIRGVADVEARFLEADGTEAELCGNGTACFVRWFMRHLGEAASGDEDRQIRILTPAGVVLGMDLAGRTAGPADHGEYVQVCIPLPENIRRDLSVSVDGRRMICDYAEVGVPHLVTYVDDIDGFNMERLGPALRRHEMFAPRGVNANFVQVLGRRRIAVRTFEFGVEGETLACGTGSAAAAILTALREGWGGEFPPPADPVEILSRGGDVLRVYFSLEEAEPEPRVTDVCLETVVRSVYGGVVHPDLAAYALDGPVAESVPA